MRSVLLKLLVSEREGDSLLRTMEAYTRAFGYAAEWGYQHHDCSKRRLQYAIYYEMRKAVPELGAGLIQSAKDTACEALKRCQMRTVPRRREHAAVRLPWKDAKVYFGSGKASIYSVDGRIHARVVLYDYLKKYAGWECKITNLIWNERRKEFYLCVVIEDRTPVVPVKGDVLGIDRGLKNVAVCSNNMFFGSGRINAARGRYAKNKAELQAKGTRSAKRRLKQQSGREKRFVVCENHRTSKTIVSTGFAVFALEDLKGMGESRWLDRRLRTRLSHWSYFQLERFIEYKAEELGKSVVKVDPTCTSQWCSRCGWIEKANRSGGSFRCVRCGFQLNADLNASRNIARLGISEAGRLPAYQPHASGDEGGLSGAHSKVPSPDASRRIPTTVGTSSGSED